MRGSNYRNLLRFPEYEDIPQNLILFIIKKPTKPNILKTVETKIFPKDI